MNNDSRIPSENRDPLSGTPGAHPVGTGVGAAAGGIAAGAAVGTVAGPVGTLVGAAVGAIAGGLVGKGVAEGIDPTIENDYWRENYASRPYVRNGESYERYQPAYRYGWESRARLGDRSWDEAESELGIDWGRAPASEELDWDHARSAVRDAWNRVPMQPAQSADKV